MGKGDGSAQGAIPSGWRYAAGLVAISLALTPSFATAQQQQPEATAASPQPSSPTLRASAPAEAAIGLASANNAVGEALMARLRGKAEANVLISPVSLSASLALLAQGAAGPTNAAFAKALRLPSGMSVAALGPAYAALRAHLSSPSLTVEQANGVWGAAKLEFVPAFRDAASRSFGARAESIDFGKPAAVVAINSFVAIATSGKITEAIQELPRNTRLVLVNALYFKGAWAQKFDRAKTVRQPFHRPGAAPINRAMMHATGTFRYLEDANFQSVALPYTDQRFELVVMLPRAGATLVPEWVNALDSGRFESRPGMLALPRMKIAWKMDVLGPLRIDGFDQVLGQGADYSGLTPSKVVISQVVHSALLEVDEDGAEGGAATVVIGSRSVGPVLKPFTLTIDRPYHLLLREKLTGAALFLGYVADPGVE